LNQIVVTNGAQYLIAKYDAAQAGSLVWYIGGVNDTYEVPSTLNGLGVSHITSFNPTTGTPGTGTPGTGNPGGSTPEPASLALFGLGLLGAGYRFRRRTA
jgi:hypothetical protein